MKRRTERATNPVTGLSKQGLHQLSNLRRAEIHNIETSKQDKIEDSYGTASVAHSSAYRNILVKKATSGQTVLPTTRGMTDMLGPEVYSPLFQLANLNLPRDRVTMNAWNRVFYDTHPIVRNAINLHASYPISKINISHPVKEIQDFFLEMAEKIDLYSVVYGAALEFWKLGEVFPYAELDRETNSWKKITILNPDFIHVKKAAIGDHTIISLKPDAGLQRLVNSSAQSDIALKKRLPKHIIDAVKKGESIPLDGINISHLKLLSSPYDIRGTSVIVSVYKDLMHYDKLRECYDAETEVLTNQGFKKYEDIIDVENQVVKSDVLIASYDEKSQTIQYQKPTNCIVKDFNGEMVSFKSKNIDLLVTPGHEVYLNNESDGWHKTKAENLLNKKLKGYKVKNVANWEGKTVEYFEVLGKQIPAELYLKFLGYLISEGSITQRGYISFTQSTKSDCYNDIKSTMVNFFKYFDREICQIIRQPKQYALKSLPKESWQGSVGHKHLANYFKNEIGSNKKCGSFDKHIPRNVLDLPPSLLSVLLKVMVAGDGSDYKRKHCTTYKYFTASKQLANDVQEAVFKCGFYSSLRKYKQKETYYYEICWSTSGFGKEPGLYNSRTNKSHLTTQKYNDKVWCVTVPSGIVVVRRNGKVAIQGQCKFAQADGMVNPLTLVKMGGSNDYRPTQSDLEAMRTVLEEAQYDKDFKIITHDGVTIERVGFSGSVLDIAADLEFIINNLYIGLMVPKSIIEQESVTYASSSIGLEVLRQRYDIFRNMMKKWLEQKIFAPISELQEFFVYKDGQKILQVPTVDFNHMNLYDINDYIQGVSNFVANKQISLQTLYRSLGLSYDEEKRRLREEAIDFVKSTKELEALQAMRLRELENLDPNGVIPEPPEGMGGTGDMDGPEDLPGLDLPGMPGGGPPGPSGPSGGGSGPSAPPEPPAPPSGGAGPGPKPPGE